MENNFTSSYNSSIREEIEADRIFKGIVMFIIIAGSLFGNALVIISVLRFRRLRSVLTNYFILSLAWADFLVALLVMPFNASVTLTGGRWLFGRTMCDLFNSNDVLFSTASIVHLCCISMDRYIAIMNPLAYESKMTPRRIGGMLALCWLASALISYIPIHTGIYTTPENLQALEKDPNKCHFVVNPYYAVLSSIVSFWIPSLVMSIVYYRIFIEARKQEKRMCKIKQMASPAKQHQSPSSISAKNGARLHSIEHGERWVEEIDAFC